MCPLFSSWLHTSGCPLWPCPRELVCALSHKRDTLGCGEDGKDEGNKQQGEIGMKACTCVWSKTSCQHWRWKRPNYSILLFWDFFTLKSNTCQPWGKAWIPQSPAPAYVSSDICSTESSDSFLSWHVDSMTVYTEPLYYAGYAMRKLPNYFKKKMCGMMDRTTCLQNERVHAPVALEIWVAIALRAAKLLQNCCKTSIFWMFGKPTECCQNLSNINITHIA